MLDFAEIKDVKDLHSHRCFTCKENFLCTSSRDYRMGGCKDIFYIECKGCIADKLCHLDTMSRIINAG